MSEQLITTTTPPPIHLILPIYVPPLLISTIPTFPFLLFPMLFLHSHSTPHQLHVRRPPVRMDSSSPSPSKDKIVVIMGATGCGKSKLSIDLATRFFPQSEIINSDKMQVYKDLDITTNKIPLNDRLRVPHHLLGVFDPDDGEFSPSDFRLAASLAVSDITQRQNLALLVGGSNSFIHAFLVDRFNPDSDVFANYSAPVSTQLRYNCCFLWVDVSFPVLCDYLCRRVDEMLDSGMFEELAEYYDSGESASQPGLRKAIGVPEFDPYFKKYPPSMMGVGTRGEWDEVRRGAYEEAVREIKDNTCQLAKRQIRKIMRLKGAGWDLQRVDATQAFKVALDMKEVTAACTPPPRPLTLSMINNNININININNKNKKKKKRKKKRWVEVWEGEVVEASMKIVNRFLEE